MKPVSWKNTAGLDNIPDTLQPLVARLIKFYQNYYGSQLKAVYMNGSVVRGEWKPGHDIDVMAFVRGEADADDTEVASRLQTILRESGAPISHIDSFTMSDALRRNPRPRPQYRLMTIALDGARVWGKEIELHNVVPSDPAQFAAALYFDFKNAYHKYLAMTFNDSPEMIKRATRLTKMVPRLANGIAVMHGAPFSSSYTTMLEHIKQWAPEWYKKAQTCFAMRKQSVITAADIAMMLATLGELIDEAERLGTTFAPASECR